MEPFLGTNYLLPTEEAQRLYFDDAEPMPIFDYHCHLSPAAIRDRQNFENLTQLWLSGDHYKWRAMRVCGVDEAYITGNAPDREKFHQWACVVPKLIGCPLYQWTHLELRRYFGITLPLSPETEDRIWEECREMLTGDGFDTVSLLAKMRVKTLCTTDEPFDLLSAHKAIAQGSYPFRVLPTFRPDKILQVDAPNWLESVRMLAQNTDTEISRYPDLLTALIRALDRFSDTGCLLSDHAFYALSYTSEERGEAVFQKATGNNTVLSAEDIVAFQSSLMRFLASEYTRRGMAMQLHLGALRNNHSRMFRQLGPDTGYDSVGAPADPVSLSHFFDDLASADALPKTILYSLNASDNTVLSTMAVNFAGAPVPGRIQLGSAWWLNDTIRGIDAQLDELLETGLLSTFIGMLTDSRSFTSFPRHEFFRRILCRKLGALIHSGDYPPDFETAGTIVRGICYENAVQYFAQK